MNKYMYTVRICRINVDLYIKYIYKIIKLTSILKIVFHK